MHTHLSAIQKAGVNLGDGTPPERGGPHTRYGTPASHVAKNCGVASYRSATLGTAIMRYAMRHGMF